MFNYIIATLLCIGNVWSLRDQPSGLRSVSVDSTANTTTTPPVTTSGSTPVITTTSSPVVTTTTPSPASSSGAAPVITTTFSPVVTTVVASEVTTTIPVISSMSGTVLATVVTTTSVPATSTSGATPATTSTSPAITTSTSSPNTSTANKTSIRIVYAASDPQSIGLLRDGIQGLFTRPSVLNVTTLQLVPYGKAMEMKVNTLSEGFLYWHPELAKGNITNVYRCPNGEGECETSLIHACAIHAANNDPTVYVPFIGCMAGSELAPEDSSFACSNSTVFMESLRTCALGAQGIDLQHDLATQASGVSTIPAIFINHAIHPFNVTTASVSKDFVKLVCDALFAEGRLDRDQCEGTTKQEKAIVLPFESLLTQPTATTKTTINGKL